jgi:hypothetical protein
LRLEKGEVGKQFTKIGLKESAIAVSLPENEIHLEMEKEFTGRKIAFPIETKFFQHWQKSNANPRGRKK